MLSAAEAELGALIINAKQSVAIRTTLTGMKHPQPPTPIQMDNSTVMVVFTNAILPKATKAIDMHFHQLRDCKQQNQEQPI